MRHSEICDLWLQKEVEEGKVLAHKVLGTETPADLMTKILTLTLGQKHSPECNKKLLVC